MPQFPIKDALLQGTADGTVTGGTLNITAAEVKPCFAAYCSSSTTLPSGSATKVLFATEEFDSLSNYSTVNSRFTAPIAGKYCFHVRVVVSGSLGANAELSVYKNGSKIKALYYNVVDPAVTHTIDGSVVLSLAVNDYIEVFAYNDSGSSRTTSALQVYTQFAGYFVSQ
jgi:hypothetical protein